VLRSARPAVLSFRENKDLEANQTGSHTNAVGRKGGMPRPFEKRQMNLSYQDTDR